MLYIYKTYQKAYIPKFATEGSACFDLHASLIPGTEVKVFLFGQPDSVKHIISDSSDIVLAAGSRALVPTNLILDIPVNHSVRIHPRSGTAIKQGLMLANCEGVIDSDYVDPLFIALYNASGVAQTLKDGDRLAQAELIKTLSYPIAETTSKPVQKTTRVGGFGSTGV